MSRLLVTMLAAVADFERSLIRERTVLGLRKAAEDANSYAADLDRHFGTLAPGIAIVLVAHSSGRPLHTRPM